MGWLRLVGSLKVKVFFAKEPYKRDDILQNRPITLRSLLLVATPYLDFLYLSFNSHSTWLYQCMDLPTNNYHMFLPLPPQPAYNRLCLLLTLSPPSPSNPPKGLPPSCSLSPAPPPSLALSVEVPIPWSGVRWYWHCWESLESVAWCGWWCWCAFVSIGIMWCMHTSDTHALRLADTLETSQPDTLSLSRAGACASWVVYCCNCTCSKRSVAIRRGIS